MTAILRTKFVASGFCPFEIEGALDFSFHLPVVASWWEDELDDVLYSPVPDQNWVDIHYITDEIEIDETLTFEDLLRRGVSAFKLCDLLDENKAESEVWASLLSGDYEELA